jgi:hypothetical protein
MDVNMFDTLPDEIMLEVFKWVALLDPETMMTVVHAVCRRWQTLCGDTRGVRLDFRFLPPIAKLRSASGTLEEPEHPTRRWISVHDVALWEEQVYKVASIFGLRCRFKDVVEIKLHNVLMCTCANTIIIALVERCPHLINVDFGGCLHLTDVSVVALAKQCPLLTNVNFGFCKMLTKVGVVALAKHCPKLTHVDFLNCSQMTDVSVVALANHCPLLTTVYFYNCYHLTDASVVVLAEYCPLLTMANFSNCFRMTDVSVVALANLCPLLTRVTFSATIRGLFYFDKKIRKLTDASLVALAKHCPKLPQVNFDDRDRHASVLSLFDLTNLQKQF